MIKKIGFIMKIPLKGILVKGKLGKINEHLFEKGIKRYRLF